MLFAKASGTVQAYTRRLVPAYGTAAMLRPIPNRPRMSRARAPVRRSRRPNRKPCTTAATAPITTNSQPNSFAPQPKALLTWSGSATV